VDAPSLRTKRLVLLPLGSADLDEAAALFADPRVMVHIDGGARGRSITSRLLQANERCWKTEGWGLWAIRDATSGAFIGQSGLQRIPELQDADVEFSMVIGRRNWRLGIATEAANAILYDAWGRFSGNQIHALVHPDSAAGGPFLRRIGFRRDDDQFVRGETLEVWHTQRLG
jgi:ribosomal-protein-alanine N-acetyltransferase